MSMIQEFKEFALKGNMVDMAVGIVIGGAFGKIVSSLVKDVIMPPIGLLMGGMDFSKLSMVLKEGTPAAEGQAAVEAVAINYGVFINTCLDFLIVAMAIFLVIKAMNKAKKAEEAAPEAPPEPPKEEILLGEIRDLLKNK